MEAIEAEAQVVRFAAEFALNVVHLSFQAPYDTLDPHTHKKLGTSALQGLA